MKLEKSGKTGSIHTRYYSSIIIQETSNSWLPSYNQSFAVVNTFVAPYDAKMFDEMLFYQSKNAKCFDW
jgi:CTP:phosphocholine cytidylyltransferase-like protein